MLMKSQKRKLRSLVRFDKGMNIAAVRRCCPVKESTVHITKKDEDQILYNWCRLPRKDGIALYTYV